MADIKDRIARIKPYFKGMQVENIEGEQVIYVVVNFPPKWFIVEDIEEKYGVVVQEGNELGEWIFITEFENGFDTIFDAIDYNVGEMRTAQERADLLQKKVAELKELFMDEDMPIESLRTLEFSWKGKKKVATLKPQQKTIKKETEEITTEEKEEENND